MDIEITKTIFLSVCFFTIAMLYSSVGHGGASGYLLILSFMSFMPNQMASTALLLNLLVAGISFYTFYKAGYFSLKFAVPFILASTPAAFVGGMLHIPVSVYSIFLSAILLLAAFRLAFEMKLGNAKSESLETAMPNLFVAVPAGFIIGLISGVVGIGGGILLSPLIIMAGWAGQKRTAATSAFFILVNSTAGLLPRLIQDGAAIAIPPALIQYVIVAFAGGLIGSHIGARIFSALTLKRILAVILIMASSKLIIVTIL